MKTLKFKLKIFATLLLLTLSIGSFAQQNYSREQNKEFAIDTETILNLENKYGDVNLKTWDKDSIKIEARIIVETTNEDKANKILRNISITIKKNKNTVFAKTKLSEDFRSGKKFSINYDVYLPAYTKMELINKFGDITLENSNAHIKVDLSYGDFKANELNYVDGSKKNIINLSYAKADINKIKELKLTLKYSKLNIKSSDVLIAVSRFSKLQIEKSNSIIADSKYDSFNIQSCNNLVISEGKYSDFKIDTITNSLDLNLSYGNCKINEVNENFKSIKVNSSYVASKIYINDAANYILDAQTKYCDVLYPKNSKTLEIEKSNSKTIIKAKIGTKEYPTSKVKINSNYGNVSLN